ncbi:hypothetical protein [Streptomyces sp. NPDC003247]
MFRVGASCWTTWRPFHSTLTSTPVSSVNRSIAARRTSACGSSCFHMDQ